MKRIVLMLSLGILGLVLMGADDVQAAEADCTWTGVKCCYADPPLACCCSSGPKPRDFADGGNAQLEIETDEHQHPHDGEFDLAALQGPELEPATPQFKTIVARY